MKSEKLNFKIMNCEADKANAMEKLKSRLKSLMSDMQYYSFRKKSEWKYNLQSRFTNFTKG